MSGLKKILFLPTIFLTLAVFTSAPLRAEDDYFKRTKETLSLKASLERAFQSNPRLLESEKELTIARAHSNEAKSLFYPKVNLNLNYVHYRNDSLDLSMPELGSTVLEPTRVDLSNPSKGSFTDNVYLGRMGFVQTLFAGGRLNTTYRLSQANIKRAESDFETMKRQVEYDTTRSFLGLLALREKEERMKEAFTEYNHLEKRGLNHISQMGLSRKKIALRKRLSKLNEDMHEAKMNYLQAMGVELFNDVEIEGSLEIPTVLPDLQKIIAWAKQNRPDIRQTELQAEVDQLSVNLSLAERYPVFLLGGSYELRDREFPLEQHNWNTGVSMNIPIFDGFSSLSRIKASRARAEQGRLRKVQLEDQAEREVRSSYQDFVYWRDELGQRGSELNEIEKEKASVLASNDMLARIDYIEWHLESQLDVVEALAQLNLSRASLEKSIGRSLSTP